MKKKYVMLMLMITRMDNACDELPTVIQKINCYTQLLSTLVVPAIPADNPNKQKAETVVSMMKDSTSIAANIEEFVTTRLSTVTDQGATLKARIKCLQSINSSECAALGCTSQKACMVVILKNSKDLLTPLVDSLIAGQTPAAKTASTGGTAHFDKGVLYTLTNMAIMPKKTDAQGKLVPVLGQDVSQFAQKLISALTFIDMLAMMLDPIAYSAATPTLSPAKQEEIKKIEPLEPVKPLDTAAIDYSDL